MRHNRTLTITERNILTLKAQGLTTRELSPILRLTPHSINGCLDTIFLKLDAKNATHAVYLALERRLIHPNGHKTPLEGD